MSAMIGNPLLLPDEGYNISRSVRLRSSASAYLNRTPGSAGNRKTFTISFWVKRGQVGIATPQYLFQAGSGTTESSWFGVTYDLDVLAVGTWTTTGGVTTAVFRDPSAWYHVVVAIDTTQATAANRSKIYINNVLQVTSTPTLTQNADLAWNNNIAQYIGTRIDSGPRHYFDGYLTEINFIDGQALTPSSFGETDSITGVWKPKKYTGTYGTNGFFLNFSDNSNNTAATIGKDYSGNGNNWTPNNISVTSGSTYDSMLDVPTLWADGGNGRGNYAVLNPLAKYDNSAFSPVLSNGNLQGASGGNPTHFWGTMAIAPGDPTGYYWEGVCTSMDTARTYLGIIDPTTSAASPSASYAFVDKAILYNVGTYFNTASGTGGSNSGTYTSYAANDVVMVAYQNGKIWFGKNGTWMNSGNPAAGTGAIDSAVSTLKTWLPYFGYNSTWVANFGQRPFSYTPPSGFKALNTLNLPAPTILKPKQFFDVAIYTTNGSTQTITTDGNGNALEINPNFLWNKGRNLVQSHYLANTITGLGNTLSTDTTAAESATGFFTSAGAGSFGVTSETSGRTKVNWLWAEGATQGFDIVTYTGTGSNTTVAHSLGVAPRMMIVKRRNSTGDWLVWHRNVADTGSDRVLFLNSTDAQTAASTNFNSTFPTSSVFSVGTNAATNASGGTYVAYLFSEVAGFSRFGSYTGNGSTDGPFVFCGFRPRWVMIKRTDTSGFSWCLHDTARDPENPNDLLLYAEASSAEAAANFVDMLSNGFKVRNLGGGWNASGGTYVYAAFSEHPFKNALAR